MSDDKRVLTETHCWRCGHITLSIEDDKGRMVLVDVEAELRELVESAWFEGFSVGHSHITGSKAGPGHKWEESKTKEALDGK